MRLVIQRVSEASVRINSRVVSSISRGLLILVGVETDDTERDVEWLLGKTAGMRIFSDDAGLMNLAIRDIDGDILAVSQFTLLASTRKGNRPGFSRAARPEKAILLYEAFCRQLSSLLCKEIKTGVFGADMQVSLVNDGPVTIIIDSKLKE